MAFRLSISIAQAALAEVESFVAESDEVDFAGDPEQPSYQAISPMSLVETITLGMALYSISFEPLIPLLRRLVSGGNDVVIKTKYGSVQIRGDAPISQDQLISALRPLLPNQISDV